MGRRLGRVKTEQAARGDFHEVHLGGARRAGGKSGRGGGRGSSCRRLAVTFQISLEGAQTEPLVAGELDLRQTAFAETRQNLADFKGAAVAPRGEGMLHVGNIGTSRKSAVDSAARTHTLQTNLYTPVPQAEQRAASLGRLPCEVFFELHQSDVGDCDGGVHCRIK